MLRRCVWSRNIKNGCSIYIYDISRLRVKKSAITTWPVLGRSTVTTEAHLASMLLFVSPALLFFLSFFLSLILPCPLLFFVCSLPHEFSFLSPVIGIPHAICHSIAYPYLLCRLSLPTSARQPCFRLWGVRKWTLPLPTCPAYGHMGFLGSFAKFRKATLSLVMPVCPSAWNNSAPAGRIFTKFHICSIFWNSAEKIQVLLKSDKNNVCFAWRPTYIFNNISLSSS